MVKFTATTVVTAILLSGCTGPAKGSLAYIMEKQRQVLNTRCLNENLPHSYAEAQFVDEFAITTACSKWSHRQVSDIR